MRFSTGLALAALLFAAPPIASAQSPAPDAAGTSPVVKSIDRAGESMAAQGAPGTLTPDVQGVGKAPGLVAPFETPVPPGGSPKPGAADAK